MNNWLICYDIEDDRERARVFKCLKKYGHPVQKSVFEVSFPDSRRKLQDEMIERLREIVGEDANIRFYRLTRKGLRASWALNGDVMVERPGAIIL